MSKLTANAESKSSAPAEPCAYNCDSWEGGECTCGKFQPRPCPDHDILKGALAAERAEHEATTDRLTKFADSQSSELKRCREVIERVQRQARAHKFVTRQWLLDALSATPPAEVQERVADLTRKLDQAQRENATLGADNERFARELLEADNARREGRQLLRRFVKYAREDRAVTPGCTRLERLTEQIADYLRRTNNPRDILRGDEP